MSTYYGVKGQKVQGISSDPTNLTTGQIWYNSSTQVIRVRTVLGSNAWATGNSLNAFFIVSIALIFILSGGHG